MSKKVVSTVGKKKSSTARASMNKGKGRIAINSVPLDNWGSLYERTIIMEPLTIIRDSIKNVDIDINVTGGGMVSQAVASRVAMARGVVGWTKDDKIKKVLLEYDDKILSGDSRQREPCKPNDSSARAKRQKSYR